MTNSMPLSYIQGDRKDCKPYWVEVCDSELNLLTEVEVSQSPPPGNLLIDGKYVKYNSKLGVYITH